MAYATGYDNFDGYGRVPSMSRRSSLYAASPYPHQGMYPDSSLDPSYSMYAPSPGTALVPVSRRLGGPSYDDMDLRDSYYPDQLQMAGSYVGTGTPMIRPRHRRHSTVSFSGRPQIIDDYRRPSNLHIKFKRRGAFAAGIGLDEAQSHIRLSNNESYSMYDLHADGRGRILLKVRWAGYSSMTYEIPLEGYDGRVNLQTLARRISRACVHYLQANVIPIVWNRVQLHHLEEVSYGVWQPMLSSF